MNTADSGTIGKLGMTLMSLWLYASMASQQQPMDASLTMTLSQGTSLLKNDSLVALDLIFTNVSGHNANLIIPSDLKSYGQMFQVLQYRREGLKWQYHKTLLPPTDSTSQISIWNLDNEESYRQTLVLHIDSSDTYAYQAQYDPSQCNMFEFVFAYTDSSGKLIGNNTHIAEILKWQGPLRSNLFIPTKPQRPENNNSKMSQFIQSCKWVKVQRRINRGDVMPKGWPVMNDQLYSQSVICSLPTFSHHSYLVETKDGIQYITLVYQLGKIYRTRSRISSLMRCMGIRNVSWRISDERAVKLISLKSIAYESIFR